MRPLGVRAAAALSLAIPRQLQAVSGHTFLPSATNTSVISMSTSPATEASPGVSYPSLSGLDATSPTDSVIAGDFGGLSAAEQDRLRQEWKDELAKTEEEILTLKQVLASKEAHAAGLKRRLGITAWREFSEDMTQGIKNIQDSNAYKKTVEGVNVAKEKTVGLWNTVTSSTSFMNVSEKVNSALGAAKTKMSQSMSHSQGFGDNNGHAKADDSATDDVLVGNKPAASSAGDK